MEVVEIGEVVAQGLALIFTGLSIKPLIDSLIPPGPAEKTTNVKFVVGSNDKEDGHEPNVHVFDYKGETIGAYEPPYDYKIDRGIARDISIVQSDASSASAQAEYISVIQSGNDAICLSAIVVNTPDGVKYAFYGDIGFSCGAPWFHGNTTVSVDNGIYQPRCIWLDGDGSDNIKAKAYGIHLPSFLANEGRAKQYNSHNDIMCKSDPRFHVYNELKVEDSIPYFKEKPFDDNSLLDFDNGQKALDKNNWASRPVDPNVFKKPDPNSLTSKIGRSDDTPSAKAPRFTDKLVISPQPNHSATELCDSATSVGPDFVSLVEGVFCDMEQRKTYPLCAGTTKINCFDRAANVMRLDKRNARRDENGHIMPRKAYKEVQSW